MFDEAEYLGLPYAPPSISIRSLVPLTGLNYASGVCGILPETGSLFVSYYMIYPYYYHKCSPSVLFSSFFFQIYYIA